MTVRRVERDECTQQGQRAQTETDDGRTVPDEPHGAQRKWRGAGDGRSTDCARRATRRTAQVARRRWRTKHRRCSGDDTTKQPRVVRSIVFLLSTNQHEASVERLATVNLTTIWKSWGNLQSLGGGRDFPFGYEGKTKIQDKSEFILGEWLEL